MRAVRLLLVHTGRSNDGLSKAPFIAECDFPANCEVTTSSVTAESLARVAPDAIIIVHTTNRMAALDAVRKVRELCANVPVLLLAAESSEEFAIDAFHSGVNRYLKFPWKLARLASVIHELTNHSSSEDRSEEECILRGSSCLVGTSAPMCDLRSYIRQVARAESNVLITGETGTGKELVAQLIHENSGRRRRPFVCLNCAAIPEALVESELFGYEKGAFTGAQSAQDGKLAAGNHGTVFFDEIGDVSTAVQAKLLRAIESKTIYRLGSSRARDLDIRILAATNQNLEEATLQNRFREDLYYRLNVIRIEIPPLRERVEDLPALVQHYIRHFNPIFHKEVTALNSGSMEMLSEYSWPGNVRELRNVLEAAFVNLATHSTGVVDLPLPIARHLSPTNFNPGERTRLLHALTTTNWNKTEAAKKLHWSRMTLYRKMTRYQVRPPH